ncbi:MAG: flagellar FlbD family protein [Alicyclobacillus sp.]|nr:flagellar FlbD family protein [Alicyclobacillus sp.]
MIAVTRLNGTELWLNPLLIESIEQTPDTVVTLTNAHKYVVRQSAADIAAEVAAFLRSVGLVGSAARRGEEMA